MAAACECAHANLQARNDIQRVSVRWPDHDDFNNMLMNGDQVRELVFYRKKAVA
ncbi:TPA: DNA primase, partial [Escherichia coli]